MSAKQRKRKSAKEHKEHFCVNIANNQVNLKQPGLGTPKPFQVNSNTLAEVSLRAPGKSVANIPGIGLFLLTGKSFLLTIVLCCLRSIGLGLFLMVGISFGLSYLRFHTPPEIGFGLLCLQFPPVCKLGLVFLAYGSPTVSKKDKP